jgi:uncharacterized protein YjbI with pentapeptide repeats
MSTDKLYLNAIILIALVLSPFWLLFFFYTLQALFGIVLSSTPATDTLTHYGALSALVLTLGALIAGPLLLVKAFINERQTATAEASRITHEHGQVTDRFTKAVNQLGAQKTVHKRAQQPVYQTGPNGSYATDKQGQLIPQRTEQGKTIAKWESWTETEPNLEIRLGGLFALERISQISEREHVAVMETLCAYIRENAQSRIEVEATDDSPPQYTAPRADIQMAIKIIGRRGVDRIKQEARLDPPYRLDLRGADLAIVDFSGGKFGPARMERTNLYSAWLDNTSFRGADFSSANMTEAWLEEADLQGARLEEAVLNGAWIIGANLQDVAMDGAELRNAKMSKTNLLGAELDGVYLDKTDISGANMQLVWLRGVDCRGFDNIVQDQIDSAFGDTTTTLPDGFTRPLWPRQQITYMESFEMWVDAKKQKGLF